MLNSMFTCLLLVLAAAIQTSNASVFATKDKFTKISPAASSDVQRSCGVSKVHGADTLKIFGNSRDAPELSFAVAIFNHTNAELPLCTGALISRQHVLTAAHCFVTFKHVRYTDEPRELEERSHAQLYVFMPLINEKESVGHYFEVQHVHWHKGYGETQGKVDDIAIVQLKSEIPYKYFEKDSVGVVCLPDQDTKLQQELTAYGFGFDPQASGTDHHRKAKSIKVESVPREQCQKSKHLSDQETKRIICVKEERNLVCQGDSGGSLLQPIRRIGTNMIQWQTLGTVMRGAKCRRAFEVYRRHGKYKVWGGGLFTDLRRYSKWICELSGVCYMKA